MDQDPIPWPDLRAMSNMEQEAWWRGVLSPASCMLLGKLVRETGQSYTDCVVGLIGDNMDLVRKLILERRARRSAVVGDDAISEDPTQPFSDN